jgi:hypothetical protein
MHFQKARFARVASVHSSLARALVCRGFCVLFLACPDDIHLGVHSRAYSWNLLPC